MASSGVNATTNAIGVLDNSFPNFTFLVQDVGAGDDSYAYRGKVRSMRDVMNTLLRHTSLLLDDLNGLESQEASCKEDMLAKLEELSKVMICSSTSCGRCFSKLARILLSILIS